MKITKRLLSILIIVVTLLLAVVAFASCGKCDHEWKEWNVTKEATCLEQGEKTRECKHCSETEKANIEKLPHKFENYTEQVAPTCITVGTEVATCVTEGCSVQSTRVINTTPHDEELVEVFAGDCVNQPYNKWVCKNDSCGAERIEKLGDSTSTGTHNYGDGWICLNDGCNAEHPVEAIYDVHSSGSLIAKIYIKNEYNAATDKNKNVYYLVFEGDGEMIDFTSTTLPWDKYTRRIERVIIDENVASLGAYALANLQSLTSVTIPGGIASIPEGLFYGSQVTSIVIPSSIASIGASAFEGCTKLETVTFAGGSQCASVNEKAFYGCSALTKVDLPENLESIEAYAFAGCTKLASINVSENTKYITSNAFEKTGLRAKDGATSAEKEAAFINYLNNCEYLPIGNNDYAIFLGVEAGAKASVKSLVLSNSTVAIAYGALEGANNLEFISVESGNSKFVGIQNCIIDTENKTLVLGIQSSEIPNDNTVNTIAKYAFLNCISLKKIVVPSTIKEIEQEAFKGCTSLEEITVPFTGTYTDNANHNVNFYAIFGDENDVPASLVTVKLTNVTTIYSNVFEGCSNIKNLYLPTSLTFIDHYAFNGCTSLKTVHVDSIDFWFNLEFANTYSNPFSYANDLYVNGELLETLVVPEGITEIKYSAFAGCDSITAIDFSSNTTLITISNSAFKDCSSLETITIPNTVKNIGVAAFANCESLEKVIISEQVEKIPANLFIACTSLKEINFGANITSIDVSAFLSCLSLSKVTVAENNAKYFAKDGILYTKSAVEIIFIPHAIDGKVAISEAITTIPAGLFANHPYLDEIIIHDGVEAIGKDAFKGCTGLTKITLPFIGESAASNNTFSYIFGKVPTTLQKVVIKNAVSIREGEFAELSKLEEIQIINAGENFTIGAGAFKNCYSLSKIVLPASKIVINDGAFEGCVKLSAVYYGFAKPADAEAEKAQVTIKNNPAFNSAKKYYYNATPDTAGIHQSTYWYFNENNEIVTW